MTETIHLDVKTVIGGGPAASIELIPLISDWKVPRQCLWNLTGETCTGMLTALYVLNEPIRGFGGGKDGFKIVGVCRDHDAVLRTPEWEEAS